MPNAHVIGLGKSGIAAARLLKLEGWEVTISDRHTSTSLRQQQQQLHSEGITVELNYSLQLNSPNLPALIVVSPGVPWDSPNLVTARSHGIETIGEMELAWRHLKSCPWVGITGTNGKTTTTALIAAIFQTAQFNAPACGNIGYAACDLALEARRREETKDKRQNPITTRSSLFSEARRKLREFGGEFFFPKSLAAVRLPNQHTANSSTAVRSLRLIVVALIPDLVATALQVPFEFRKMS